MARGVNKVILVGNLGGDPEVRYTGDGGAITKIIVATSERWKDKNGEQQEHTEWHNVTFFGRLAEVAGEYLKKGQRVYIEGKLKTNKVEKDGGVRYYTNIIAEDMQMLGGKDGGGGEREVPRGNKPKPPQQAQHPSPAPAQGDFDDDDIPF